jgi:hypothetical protein
VTSQIPPRIERPRTKNATDVTLIHFWLPDHPGKALDEWDPDEDPRRFPYGVAIALIQPYRRFAMKGLPVSIGPVVPREADLLVVAAKSIVEAPGRLAAALSAIARARGRFVLLRTDLPTHWSFPLRPLIEFVPNPSAVRQPWQRTIPELPQPGLIPRRPERRGRIASVAFKGNPENVPPELVDPRWARALGERGLAWCLDVPQDGGSPDQAWHDFAEVDVLLCVRHLRWSDVARKPPGKLINAWLAGSIPIAAREPAYVDIGREGQDVVFVDSVWDCLEVLDALRADPERIRAMEQAIARRATEYTPASMLDVWWQALLDAVALAEGWRVPRRLERRLAPSVARASLVPLRLAHNTRRQAGRGARLLRRLGHPSRLR